MATHKKQVSNSIRSYFLSGLAIVLPLVTTVVIAKFILRLLTDPFVSMLSFLLGSDVFFHHKALFYVIKLGVLLLMALCTVVIGAITRWYVIKKMVELGERILNLIPFVRVIYKASREVIQSFVTSSHTPFKEVVLVPFPHQNSYAVAFLIKEENTSWDESDQNELYTSVFVPTTPNPTTGFILLVKKETIITTNLSMEEGLKFVISCGVVNLQDLVARKDQSPSS